MKRSLMAALAVVALAGGLAACETATPYQRLDPRNAEVGGYSDLRLDATHWRVSFSGNGMTSRETVERYLLYRAAELTVSQGFDWFEEIHRATDKTTEVYADPAFDDFGYGFGWRPYWRFGYYGGWGPWGGGWGGGWGGYDPWGPDFVDTINRYEASAELVMGKGPKPDQKALDAHEVLTNLGPEIKRPKA